MSQTAAVARNYAISKGTSVTPLCGVFVQVCTRIAQLVRGDGLGPALSVGGTATALRVPLAIAQEHLLTAEACGTLCRDDGPEGLRFFRNFFAEVEVGA